MYLPKAFVRSVFLAVAFAVVSATHSPNRGAVYAQELAKNEAKETGAADSADVAFENWLGKPESGHFRWNPRISPIELCNQQRMRVALNIQVDGNELVSRKGHGELLLLLQVADANGRMYRTHHSLDLNNVQDQVGKANLEYSQSTLLIPGDYRVTFGIVDKQTGEHALQQRPLRVNPPKNDPLPEAWTGLPAAEFVRDVRPPDDLLLPYLKGRLHLPVRAKRPLRVELLVNTPAAIASPVRPLGTAGPSVTTFPSFGNRRTPSHPASKILGDILAAMKVMSGIEVRGGTLRLSMLDITRRKAVFEQALFGPSSEHGSSGVASEDAGVELDWTRLREALEEANPNKIDVRSLAGRDQNGQFFVEEVRRKLLGAADAPGDRPAPVIVVLSSPMTLNSGEDLKPIQLDARSLEAGGLRNAKVFYVRYHSYPEPGLANVMESQRFSRRGFAMPPQPPASMEPFDSLAPLLKPLQPRMFDVYTPEQFRKALATLIEEIERS